MPKTPSNAGETVWIIGASQGIGAAVAREYAARGAHLILSARDVAALDALNASLGGHHRVLAVDLADRASILAAVEAIAADGPVDRCLNFAALYQPGALAQADPDFAAKIVSVNLLGSFHIAQLVPRALRPGGQLAFCGSVAGYFGLPQGQIYSATKAGVMNLAQSLRVEMAGKIDVRLISPGFVDTRLTSKNAFDMPALQTPEAAAKAICDGLNSTRFEVHFPRRFTLMLKLLALLPYRLSLALTARLKDDPTPKETL